MLPGLALAWWCWSVLLPKPSNGFGLELCKRYVDPIFDQGILGTTGTKIHFYLGSLFVTGIHFTPQQVLAARLQEKAAHLFSQLTPLLHDNKRQSEAEHLCSLNENEVGEFGWKEASASRSEFHDGKF